MKNLLPIFTFGLIFYLFLFLFPNKAFAGHPFGTEGFYCDTDSIWHDVPGTEPGRPYGHELREDCGGDEVCRPIPPKKEIYTQEAECKKTGTRTPRGSGTNMYASPIPIVQGQSITIGITADKAYVNLISPTFWPAKKGLKVGGRLSGCAIVSEYNGCDKKLKEFKETSTTMDLQGRQITITKTVQREVDCGPDDWNNPWGDRKQFSKNIVCRADAIGQFNAPFVTGDSNADNNVDYTIVAQPPILRSACNKKEGSRATTTIAGKENDIAAPNLQTDEENFNKLSVIFPTEINKELDKLKLEPPPKTGVAQTFVAQFACFARGIPIIGEAFAPFCSTDVFFNDYAGTNFFSKQSTTFISAIRPPSIQSPPAPQDCAIQDITLKDSGATIGNQRIDEVNTAIGTQNGFYSINLPEITPDLNLNENLSLNKTLFDVDNRVPDVEARCRLYSQSNLPEGLSFCNSN